AGLKPLEVNLGRTEREKARLEGLASIQAVPSQVADEAGSAAELTKAQLAAAQINVDAVKVQLEECTLKAPKSGVVTRRNYAPGELLLPGAALLTMVDLREVHTVLYVSNAEVGRVRLGQTAEVVADTYPGRTFRGTVIHVNEQAEFTPKSTQTKDDRTRLVFGVKVRLQNDDMALRAGMPVEAVLVEEKKK
ncbi:MAG: efflux RND transporter periplasmic adaptor subunit, partial [Myxococcota bacterium]|nr:efflux RND transporter periplasmic adaptor subunit [Myxococcota bacterium]